MQDSRSARFKNTDNPVQQYLEWDQKLGFVYWDKDAKEKKPVKGLKFLIIEEFKCITGFNKELSTGIYSNEVLNTAKEKLKVYTRTNGLEIEGIYREIKDKVIGLGGGFSYALYAMTPKGSFIKITMKKSSRSEWIEFTQKCRNRLRDEWIKVAAKPKTLKSKLGSDYTVPSLAFDGTCTEEEMEQADRLYLDLKEYKESFTDQDDDVEDDVDETTQEEKDFVDGIGNPPPAKQKTDNPQTVADGLPF